jgi:hypothetical protein
MRAFLWLLTAAVGVLCISCWVIAELAVGWYAFRGVDSLPGLTRLVLQSPIWLLFVPLPWIIYSSVLSLRREVTVRAAFIFAGTIALAMSAVVSAVVVAACLPLFPLKFGA